MTTSKLLLAAILVLGACARASAQVGRMAVPSDDRITDATVEFDDAKYPRGKVSELVFWGYEGAKTDESADQDRLCDLDVANLRESVAFAAARAGAKPGDFKVEKTVIVKTGQVCVEQGETPKGSGRAPAMSCTEQATKHCAAKLSTTSAKHRFQYKIIKKDGIDPICREAVVKEMAAGGVVGSKITPTYGEGYRGCAAHILEIVAAD